MKRTAGILALLTGLLIPCAGSTYTSLYVFGDSLSGVYGGGYQYPPPPGTSVDNYFQGRFSNGKVWVEYLAAQQGIAFDTNKDFSFFGNTVEDVLNDIIYGNYDPPPDAGTSLFVLWSASSDCFANVFQYSTNAPSWSIGTSNAMVAFGNAIDLLYSQGIRTMVIPNSVDISMVPLFTYSLTNLAGVTNDLGPYLTAIRGLVQQFNTSLAGQIASSRAAHGDLIIFAPDFFAQFNFLLTHPAAYGITKENIDALEDASLTDKSFTGPGANYLFWDYLHPTTKVHAAVANFVQQIISPLRTTGLTHSAGTDRFELSNLPIGRTGTLESTTSLRPPMTWTVRASIVATSATQSIAIPTSGLSNPSFFRVNFPP
jgi:thermolabile hemolysin